MKLPLSRHESVVVQELEKETLIYDLKINKAYCLNESLSAVYRHCDSATSIEDLKRRYKYTDDLIFFALDELKAGDLLIDYEGERFKGLSRREVIKKVGLASMIAPPLIAAMIAPPAAQASSSVAACTTNQNIPPNAVILFTPTAEDCRRVCSAASFNQCDFNNAGTVCACYR